MVERSEKSEKFKKIKKFKKFKNSEKLEKFQNSKSKRLAHAGGGREFFQVYACTNKGKS